MKKKYQTGGPITPNYQTLGNIKFDSNKARWSSDKSHLIVTDVNTGKDFGVNRNTDGSYRWKGESEHIPKVNILDSLNPKNWGLEDYSAEPEFTNAFNEAKTNKQKEFYWKGKRFAVKDIAPSLKNAVNIAKQQVINNIREKETMIAVDPVYSDTIAAIFAPEVSQEERLAYLRQTGPSPTLGPKANEALQKRVAAKENELVNYYEDKIQRLNKTNPILTSERGKLDADGYTQRNINKMFVYTPDSLRTVNTARHEFEHVAQDVPDFANLVNDQDKVLATAQRSQRTTFKPYNQADFDYIASPVETGARLFNLKVLMKEKNLKTPEEAINWSLANRIRSPKSSDSIKARMTGYDDTDPYYDVHQLIDLYSSNPSLLDKHLKDYDTPLKRQYASGGSIHIDPANKGKFNATKKRTGKTTEELTHSSNPLTRKRAIFAQNAAKWHHAAGGEISSGQQLANGIGGLSGLLGMVNPIAGAAAAALPALASLFKAPDKTVISASPGNYSSGGLTGLLPQEAFAGAQPPQMSKGSFASGGPTDPPLQFLGRKLSTDPASWHGPSNDSGIFGLRDSNRFTPEQINMGKNTVQATKATPYMLLGDNIYYNPYDKVYNSRQDDGSYTPIETSRMYTTRRTGRGDRGPIDPKHFADTVEKNRWKRRYDTNPYMNDYQVDSKLVEQHLKKYPLSSYASGGPTDPPARDNTYVHPKPIQTLANAPRNFQVVPDPMVAVPLAIEAMQNQQTINPLHVPGITTSGKSLSRPRFREHATGGDVQLASDAFQVKGNPNVTDGNNYGDVKLDHNEVVTKTQQGGEFVFSDDLKHPSGLSYAKVAARHSAAKGKAEKILKMSPYDEQAKSTISQSNALLEQLANQQEAQATKMGLRNNDGSTKQHFATGGSTDGPGDPVYIAIPGQPGFFYDPYQGRMLQRDANTGQYRDVGLSKEKAASYLSPSIIQNHLAKYPQTATTPPAQQQPVDPNFIANRTYEGLGEPQVPQTVTPQVGTPTGPTTPKSRSSKPTAKLSAVPSWLTKARAYMKGVPTPGEQQPFLSDVLGLKYTSTNPYTSTPEQRLKVADPNFAEGEWTANHDRADTPTMDMSNYSAAKASTDNNYKTAWTFGDTLKAIELGAKGIGAFGKAEKEAPLLDNTQITQQTYDPTNALYQNQRSFQNFANSATGSTSINMRRGLLNSALANRYSSDNNVLSQYQQMNQGAKTDFQQRSSAQRQFNVQSQFNTNNINAANRAAQDALQQNFFTSVGQFGEDLNRKRYANDTINLLKQQYPDIFNSYISTIQ